jgi:rod shape determining protein RodA
MVVLGFGAAGFVLLWAFVLAPYQKARLETFLNPVADIRGSGYNVNQAMIAFGSGEVFGKGLGFGTQSRLKFLPEYQTDFVIAAFAEEWGFLGMLFFFSFFSILLARLLYLAHFAATNFERLFILGTALLFMIHLVINVGMNMGVMPVTGITLTFLSYGGSHLMIEGMLLGIITSMTRYARVAHPEKMHNEFFGLER